KVFQHKLQKSARGEFEIVDYLNFLLVKKEKVFVEKVSAYWFPIGYPWDLLTVNEFFVSGLKESKILGTVEENVHIKGKIILGKGSVLKSGTYIEGNVVFGENCEIGPNCYIRGNTSIGDKCKIGQAVEVKNSTIGDGTKIPHLSYFGDSVIEDNCNFGAGTIVANLRHDHGTVNSLVKGEKINSGRKKLGIFCGDNVKTGINTSFYPGIKIWPGQTTLPGEIVKEDKD
ncbi:MAG: DapH/DapD/GlmU-related protein, partial [Candidatus Diapherotrites archaeon]|nr:DapH/DapD/GlmU-related protein [Candidatus Diapherotrites archaeon]